MAQNSPDRSQLIQAYMLLHSQQTHVRRRLSQDSMSSVTSNTSESSNSTSSSPTMSPSSPSSPMVSRRDSRSHRMSSSPSSRRPSIEPIPELPEAETSALALSNDEIKLADLSNRIKSTLTDLINCNGVRGDMRMRNWVATRLMDVEHEIKDSRRRRHSADAAQVGAIAASLRE
ncbi:hypothetical protein AAFC00_001000 [Neodothiora populina]|uniref:Uncharacterized protein n=1 Tax=Neodothiora populina TaxID=2781224 RepID=A0ABR3PMR3_9PEZI